jgi:hypothetical protein
MYTAPLQYNYHIVSRILTVNPSSVDSNTCMSIVYYGYSYHQDSTGSHPISEADTAGYHV